MIQTLITSSLSCPAKSNESLCASGPPVRHARGDLPRRAGQRLESVAAAFLRPSELAHSHVRPARLRQVRTHLFPPRSFGHTYLRSLCVPQASPHRLGYSRRTLCSTPSAIWRPCARCSGSIGGSLRAARGGAQSQWPTRRRIQTGAWGSLSPQCGSRGHRISTGGFKACARCFQSCGTGPFSFKNRERA